MSIIYFEESFKEIECIAMLLKVEMCFKPSSLLVLDKVKACQDAPNKQIPF